MQSHEEAQILCTDCQQKFHTESDLPDHKEKDHEIKTAAQVEWTCNDCPFQASSSSELMNHVRILAHQSSPNVKDRKKFFFDYRQCYTCKLEFDGYKNLMEHRHNMHPSKKKCRNFPDDSCTWGENAGLFMRNNLWTLMSLLMVELASNLSSSIATFVQNSSQTKTSL